MNELKKPNQPHSRYLKVGIWLVLSALILTGLAIIVGVAFEEIVGEQVSIEEIVYLPQQHDYSRGTSTLSYSMAAQYSDGSIGNLPEVTEDFVVVSMNKTDAEEIETRIPRGHGVNRKNSPSHIMAKIRAGNLHPKANTRWR